MRKKKKITCSQIRVLGNGMMAAGFFLLCICVGVGGACKEFAGMIGGILFPAGFLIKLLFWRCPCCKEHLMLCVRGRKEECPYCGCRIR